jgi:hypothetical protein
MWGENREMISASCYHLLLTHVWIFVNTNGNVLVKQCGCGRVRIGRMAQHKRRAQVVARFYLSGYAECVDHRPPPSRVSLHPFHAPPCLDVPAVTRRARARRMGTTVTTGVYRATRMSGAIRVHVCTPMVADDA